MSGESNFFEILSKKKGSDCPWSSLQRPRNGLSDPEMSLGCVKMSLEFEDEKRPKQIPLSAADEDNLLVDMANGMSAAAESL